jgi:type III secretion system FlhB-like substrate exporter
MLLSVLLYGGLIAAFVGAIALLWRRTRRRAAVVVVTGVGLVLIALIWPAAEDRVTMATTKLDAIMPRWQFVERHEIRIAAPPERIYSAIRDVTAHEIRFFQILTAVRCMGRCNETESILHAPPAKPILDVALQSGFRMLSDDAPRELVIGTRVAPRTFAVMNFHVDGDGRVTTETRVFAQTDAARRKFAIYWRFIRPGSGIIRRSWLEAIKRRAEAKGTVSRGAL